MSPQKGINIDAIKQRLDALKKTNRKSDMIWKPTVQEQVIRIVPYKFNRENPFIELYFHYELAGKTLLSPVSFGRPDPIMEFAQKLKTSGDKENWKMGKKLEPKLRTFVPIIIRKKEQEGVKFWGFGKTVYEELLAHIADPEYGDITDVVSGRDIIVSSKKAEGQDYPKTNMRIRVNQTPITDDKEIMKIIVDSQIDISELYEEKSYEELTSILKKHLNPEDAPEGKEAVSYSEDEEEVPDPDSVVEEEEAPKKPAPPKPPKPSTKPLDAGELQDAFNAVFNEK